MVAARRNLQWLVRVDEEPRVVHAGLVAVVAQVHTCHVVVVVPAACTCWEEVDDGGTEQDNP